MSWYKSTLAQTPQQESYTDFIESTFVLRDAKGRKVPYKMEDYQKDFHSSSLLALPPSQWENRFVIKSRGVGCSVMCLIDYINYAFSGVFENVVFPITSYNQDAASELMRKARCLILDAEDNGYNFDADMHPTSIKSRQTGCVMLAKPGGSDESLRSYRAPAVLLDELNFYQRPAVVYDAGSNVVTEGGIIDCASTVVSFNDFFYKEYEKCKKQDLARVFELFLYNPLEFQPNTPLMEQPGEPIGHWFNIKDLEKRRLRDLHAFLREYQGQPVDEGIKFYPLPLIIQCTAEVNVNGPYRVMGMDVASIKDFAAIVEFTSVDGIWWNTFVDKQKLPYPELEEYARNLIQTRQPIRFNIDRTGVGEHLFQKLQKEFGSRVNGIHFGQRIDKQKVREFAATNLKILMQDGQVKLANDDDLIRHLNSWNATLTKVDDKTTGHGDLAVAAELALLPDDKIPREKTKKTFSGAFGMGRRFGKGTAKIGQKVVW